MGKRIEWKGVECPVHNNSEVKYFFRDGATAINNYPQRMRWKHVDSSSDIIAYEVIEEAKEEPKPEKTLRDEFAMAALAGILSDPNATGSIDELCAYAIKYADAMMKARAK